MIAGSQSSVTSAQPPSKTAKLKHVEGGYVLTADLSDGRVVALLPVDEGATVAGEGLTTKATILIQRRRTDGSTESTLRL